jgi:hypothetical protein
LCSYVLLIIHTITYESYFTLKTTGNLDVWKVCGECKGPSSTLRVNKPITNLLCSKTTNLLTASADSEIWIHQPEILDANGTFSKINVQDHVSL